MGILVNATYDPAAAVTKSTASLQAMTAFDTANLRATFTAPASGAVLIRLQCVAHGNTTVPQILLGVLDGATVKHRQAPKSYITEDVVATNTFLVYEATFVVSGLVSGNSYSYDAAYGVEVTGTANIKYGGPDNATTNDAFGAFIFEVWAA